MAEFENVVRLSFSLRRKTLRNALASRWGREESTRLLSDLGWEGEKRAEELDLESFLDLFRAAVSRGLSARGGW
jgi:16S rRNA A1518/A1519 N6-dimethyltransferase RsmA/KsgA/DIM1 with predicted DNA glycosylase/AP lyase activity